jgi:hypothetical protein
MTRRFVCYNDTQEVAGIAMSMKDFAIPSTEARRSIGCRRCCAAKAGRHLKKAFPMKIVLAVLVAAVLWPRLGWSGPSVYPTGVTVYDPARAYSSFVCFSARTGSPT